MIIKCWNLDDALGVFGEATLETPGLPIKEQQKILFKVIHEIKTKLKPEFTEDFLNEVDGYMAFDPDLEIALKNYRQAFNEEFNIERWENQRTQVHGEEADESKLLGRARYKKQFLLSRFKDADTNISAGRAMLYYQRDAKLKLLSTFMVDRDNGFLVAESQILKNVQKLKQNLLDTIVDFLKSRGVRDDQLGFTELFDEFGEYYGTLENTDLRHWIDNKLTIGKSFTTDYLKDQYELFRKQGPGWENAKLFIEAYNAKLLLDDFDAMTTLLLGNIIKPTGNKWGQIDNDQYETKFHRATQMWGNGFGDDVENIADLISIVTQELIQTSKRYTWKGEAMPDQYLSFQDFNYIITKIKSLAYNPIAKNIVLDYQFFNVQEANKNYVKTAGVTKTIEALRALKRKQGKTEEESYPTFEEVVAFISDNPQRHIHTIFELLCNTNILNKFGGYINANDRNLIWSIGKELFGHWNNEVDSEGNTIYSRSLYDLHRNSKGDRIFEIVTQIVDSMFADQYIQYYEDSEGNLKMRMLQDFSISQLKNRILHSMKETHGGLDPQRFQQFLDRFNKNINPRTTVNISVETTNKPVQPGENKNKAWKIPNPKYTPNTPGVFPTINYKTDFVDKVVIELESGFKLIYQGGKLTNTIPEAGKGIGRNKYLEQIWKSKDFRDFIQGSIGIDFNTDVELASAFKETFRVTESDGNSYINFTDLVQNISQLCASVVYNQYFNNKVVPKALSESGQNRDKKSIQLLRDIQFAGQKMPRINQESGVVEMLSDFNKESYLANLATATATVRGLLTSAQVKTGEGTALASQVLSCLRTSHPYQLLVQNKNVKSATRHSTYVNNENGFFQGVIGLREFKSDTAVRVNTDMSSAESYAAAFLGGFVGAFIPGQDTSTINRNGNAYFLPAVYSDKTKQDVLRVQLNAISKYQNIPYISMSDAQLELELTKELGTMYDSIIDNINEENLKFLEILNPDSAAEIFGAYFGDIGDNILQYKDILSRITEELCPTDSLIALAINKGKALGKAAQELSTRTLNNSEIIAKLREIPEYDQLIQSLIDNAVESLTDEQILVISSLSQESIVEKIAELRETKLTNEEILSKLEQDKDFRKSLGKLRKNRIVEQMHNMMTEYNKNRRRNPIEMCEHIHYLFDEDGRLVPNNTLMALWGRFMGDEDLNKSLGLTELYPEGHKESSVVGGYFKEKDLRTAQELLEDGMDIYLLGNLAKENQEEIKFLRESEICQGWHTDSYKMAIAKVFDPNTNTWSVVNDPKLIEEYNASPEKRALIQVHPMITKLNRLSYLAAQQYTSAVGGAHYVYKGGGENVLEEEAKRWLASNKRNVCYPSTVHKYQNKTLNGVPKYYQIAPIEDIKSIIFNIMGDLDEHKPIDGGMFVNPWFPILENNSLGGEAAGLDKKQFGTYYYERYAAGGIIKTAGFALTNQRLRNSPPYRNLCKNMTNRSWIKEYSDQNGLDIPEYLDITRDYNGNVINWVQDDNGQGTYYQRESDNGKGCGRYKLAKIEAIYSNGTDEIVVIGDASEALAAGFRPTNRYRIYEYPVTINGEINTSHPDIAAQFNQDPNTATEDLEPILRTEGADENGEITINNNWDLYNKVFGGAWSLSLDEQGELQPSENSVFQMVHALNNIGYTRTIENNDDNFGEDRYTLEELGEEGIQDQDDLWQPLKYSDISYAPNIGALKSTQMNVNPKEGMYEEHFLNAMNIMMAQLGIQLDKEHHADESEVSMPTQIISACANKGYTIHYSSKLYKSLSTLTEIAIADCMDGIMENLPGNENKGTLLTEVARIIVDKLIHSQDDNAALSAVMDHLIQKAQAGQRLTPDDVVGRVPFSDPSLYNKIYNDLASHLTNTAIKMKFPGSLAVICPTEKMEPMFGDRRLSAYSNPDLTYVDEEGNTIYGVSEKVGLQIEQERIRTTANPQLVFDEDINHGATVQEKLNLASNLNAQHHYWIEWNDENGNPIVDKNGKIFKEKITIEEPNKYFQLKNWIAYGGESDESITIDGQKLSREGLTVARVYEDIMDPRELGSFNIRFEAIEKHPSGQTKRFCIFDLDSVKALFDYNDMPEDLATARKLLSNTKFVPDVKEAEAKIKRLLEKTSPESSKLLKEYFRKYSNAGLLTAIEQLKKDSNSLEKDFISATMKICKVLTYKTMEKDLFKISKDYEGEREIWVNGELITVNPDTIKSQAYELIMPKIYQSKFGLKEGDQVQEILADPEFFTKRAVDKVKQQHVAESCFHYELKNFNGKHVYIFDTRLGEIDPEIFIPSKKAGEPIEVEQGVWERQDIDGNFVHGLSSGNDRIMQVGKLGYEVIVTDNPEYYFTHMQYNTATFSNENVTEEALQNLLNNIKGTKNRSAQKFIKSISDRRGSLKRFRDLIKRNNAIKELSLDLTTSTPKEIVNLIKQFTEEGKELYASFSKSLDIIAGRIPAQSQQSFMPQRVVAFDNNDINTAYVSTFQLFLQGSK